MPGGSYSLWAKAPTDTPVGKEMHAIVSELAASTSPPSNTFSPHVTVLTGMEGETDADEAAIIAAIRTATAGLPPIEVDLTSVASGESHWQCVYFKVAETPTVVGAHAAIKSSVGAYVKWMANPTYMPHVSLLYGHHDAAVKAAAVKRVETEHAGMLLPARGYVCDTLTLYDCDPNDFEMKTWRVIATFPLGGGAK